MASGTYEADERLRRCFRPDVPTPPRLEDVTDLLDPALDALRQFDRRLSEWPNRGVVGKLFARLDAVHSSGAEGSTTTFTDLMEYESSLRSAPDPEDAASVAACADAFAEGVEGDLPGTVLRLHRRLFERNRDHMKSAGAGRWKERTNGTTDDDAPGGTFYYTRPASLKAALAEWRDFTLAEDPKLPELVRQCLSHWMFEHIHPVSDGNGRIGRLLIPIVARDKGLTRVPCAFVAEGVHEDQQLYIESLKAARRSGDWTGWTRLMLGFVERTASANLGRLDRLAAIRREWEEAVSGARKDSVVHRLVPFALTRPVFTIQDAVTEIGATFASVNTAAGRMVEAGILSIEQGRRRDRLFQADAVLDCFDRFRAPRREPEPEAADAFGP